MKCTWLHGVTSHLKVQTCTRQGTVMAGLTAARQVSSETTLSFPLINWTQDTVLWATTKPQDTEHGNVLRTFHLEKFKVGMKLSGTCGNYFKHVLIVLIVYLAGQLWVLHVTTAAGLGKSWHSISSITTSSPSISLAQYSTLLATPPPHVTLQTPCLERHLVVRKHS